MFGTFKYNAYSNCIPTERQNNRKREGERERERDGQTE